MGGRSNILFFITFVSIGVLSVAKKPIRPRATVTPPTAKLGRNGQRPGKQSSRVPPVSSRQRKYEDDEDDDLEKGGIGFLDDEQDDEEDIDVEGVFLDEDVDDEEDPLGPVTPKGRRGLIDDDDDVLTPLPNKRRKGETLPRRELPPSAKLAASRAKGARKGPPPNRKFQQPPPGRRTRFEENIEDEEEEFERPRPRRGKEPPPRGSDRRGAPAGGKYNRGRGPPPRGGKNSGAMVPHQASRTAAAFTRGLAAIRDAMPDPGFVKDAAVASLNVARETTSSLSANLYREVKGLTSSELEQVMLKATRPDDSPVKGKHVERLVGVTYQISARYDIYDAVLRKLWGKMSEKDWRTKVKALYILHRFAADGSPDHAPALKARLRELRRTRDPKRKDKFFNSKQLLAGEAKPETIPFRAFMTRYAHYVLLRTQCFGGVFDEIAQAPPTHEDSKKAAKPPKPITVTSLRKEHLEAATMLLKSGVACQLKEGEENENTAIAVERVASDLIGLTTAVAIALNRALKTDDGHKGADLALIKQWCEFYRDELLPQTRAMVKKTSSKLDAYGLFLPSRMGTSVSPELLQKGLSLVDAESNTTSLQKSEEDESAASTLDTKEESKTGPNQPVQEEKAKVEPTPEAQKATSAGKVKQNVKSTDDASIDEEGDDEDDDDEYEDEDEEYEDEDED